MPRAGKADLIAAIDALEREQRRVAGQLQGLRELVDRLPADDAAPAAAVCPHDGLRFPTAARLEEHLANVHAA
jgi:hypothetical protein